MNGSKHKINLNRNACESTRDLNVTCSPTVSFKCNGNIVKSQCIDVASSCDGVLDCIDRSGILFIIRNHLAWFENLHIIKSILYLKQCINLIPNTINVNTFQDNSCFFLYDKMFNLETVLNFILKWLIYLFLDESNCDQESRAINDATFDECFITESNRYKNHGKLATYGLMVNVF